MIGVIIGAWGDENPGNGVKLVGGVGCECCRCCGVDGVNAVDAVGWLAWMPNKRSVRR